MSNLAKKIISNSSFHFLGRIINVAISAVLLAFLTRYLGPGNFGIYTTAIAFVALFNIFAEFGVNQIILREVSQKPKDKEAIYSNGLILKLIASLIILAIPPIVAYFFPYSREVKLGILIVSLATFPLVISSFFVTIFQTHLKMVRYTLATVLGRLLIFSLTLFFIYKDLGLMMIFWAILLGNSLELLISILASLSLERFRIKFDKKIFYKVFNEAWPIAIALGLGMFAWRINTIILSIIKEESAVGIYGVPYKIMDIIITIPSIIMGLALPLISKYYKENKAKLKRAIQKFFDGLSILGSYLLALFVPTSPLIISIIAGKEFGEADFPLKIMSLTFFFIFIGAPSLYLLIASRDQKQIIWRNLTSLICAIILGIILIPVLSYNGAALATLVAEFVATILLVYSAWKMTEILPSFAKLVGSVLSAFLAALGGYLIIKFNIGIAWSDFGEMSLGNRVISFFVIVVFITIIYFAFLAFFKVISRRNFTLFIKR